MLTLLFQTTFQGTAAAVKRGLALGFEVDFEPSLWWQRKPKALEPAVAKAKLRKVAAVVVAKAQEHAEKRVPEAQRREDVKKAVSPLLKEMPGFEAKSLYDEAYSRAVTALIAQQLKAQDEERKRAEEMARKRRLQDEEEIALLLALI